MKIHHSDAIQLLQSGAHAPLQVRELDGSERTVTAAQAVHLLVRGHYWPVARKKRVRLLMPAEPLITYHPWEQCYGNTEARRCCSLIQMPR